MKYRTDLIELLRKDDQRMKALDAVSSLQIDHCWIGAGFIRNAVWDALHGFSDQAIGGDVDVIWLDHQHSKQTDNLLEQKLRERLSGIDWSVKNQARMHIHNNDPPYSSIAEAMSNWPETATAIAARIAQNAKIEVLAPFGLNDLFQLRLRPTRRFALEKHHIFQQRLVEKSWLTRYPKLTLLDD